MSYFGSKFWLARHKDEPLRLEVTRVKESEFWLARHRDEPLRLEVTSIPKVLSGWPGTGMSHFGSKLRGSKSEFWLARHRDEPLLLESKTRGQGQSPNSDFGHRFLGCGRLLNSYYANGNFGLSI